MNKTGLRFCALTPFLTEFSGKVPVLGLKPPYWYRPNGCRRFFTEKSAKIDNSDCILFSNNFIKIDLQTVQKVIEYTY